LWKRYEIAFRSTHTDQYAVIQPEPSCHAKLLTLRSGKQMDDSNSEQNCSFAVLAVRIADQQQIIANLVTVDSEQRLGQTLLQLARTLGKKDPRSIRIELKITHEELSEMVGTTRPRISLFMQRFHNLGLIETNRDRFLIIKEHKLNAYLEQIA
jgi:hypothetical protein